MADIMDFISNYKKQNSGQEPDTGPDFVDHIIEFIGSLKTGDTVALDTRIAVLSRYWRCCQSGERSIIKIFTKMPVSGALKRL